VSTPPRRGPRIRTDEDSLALIRRLAPQAAGHEAMLGLDRAIAAFGAVGVIPRPLAGEAPLRERRIVVGVELRRRHERGVQGGGG
jgi:hypothetical protein